jgi:proteasome lid subunit RPN8/RPN11
MRYGTMEQITISKSIYQQIVDKAEAETENQKEVVGLVLGHDNICNGVFHCRNISTFPQAEYKMHPEDYGVFLRYHRAKNPEDLRHEIPQKLIGIYHSHPQWSARPSQTDIAKAYPNYIYFIYSCVSKTMTAWTLEVVAGERIMREIIIEVL